MSLMFTIVIPKLAAIITSSGQSIPFFTQVVIEISNLFVNYGIFVLAALVLIGLWIWRLASTPKGKEYLDEVSLSIPVIGGLYTKLYVARITDNLNTMLSSGVPIVRALDITSKVVGSLVYQKLLEEVADGVKSGLSLSVAFEKHKNHIPPILVQMIAVGEETGSLGSILKTLTVFYEREVDGAVDTLVGLIEPVMILVLGVGVGILCVSVLGPIYNMSSGIS